MTRRAFGFSLSISLAVAPVASAAQPLPNATVCAKPHVDAHAVHLMEPAYPNSARLRALSGTVTVKVTLDETGMLQAVSIYKSSGDADLDQAALDAAQKSTYAPEFENCRPVGGAFLVRMDFTGALAEPCPIGITEIVATTDKSVWAVRLDSWRQTAADVRLKLYTVDTLYVAGPNTSNLLSAQVTVRGSVLICVRFGQVRYLCGYQPTRQSTLLPRSRPTAPILLAYQTTVRGHYPRAVRERATPTPALCR